MKTKRNRNISGLLHGVDLVDTQRLEFTNPKLATKLLHVEEIAVYQQLETNQQIKFLALHWAIKEALYKALPKPLTYPSLKIYKVQDQYCIDHPLFELIISISYANQYILASVIGKQKH